jgi:hypothetical protein
MNCAPIATPSGRGVPEILLWIQEAVLGQTTQGLAADLCGVLNWTLADGVGSK